MRIPFKIVRNPKLPKIQRQLDLKEIWAFKSGETLYTYHDKDLTDIHNRYTAHLRENASNLERVGLTRVRYENILNHIKKLILTVSGSEFKKEITIVHDTLEKSFKQTDDTQKDSWNSLFCMFFVLDGEPELEYNDFWNKKKLELLEKETPEARVFFSKELGRLTGFYQEFSEASTQESIKKLLEALQIMELTEKTLKMSLLKQEQPLGQE